MNKPKILIPIHPQWCEKIFNGEKTIEVRRTRPKIDTPFECLVYMTATKERHRLWEYITAYRIGDKIVNGSQKVIGSFVCDGIREIIPLGLRGFKLGAEWLKEMCLSKEKLDEYGGLKTLYSWHITEPKLFDRPRELSEFYMPCKWYEKGDGCPEDCGFFKQDRCVIDRTDDFCEGKRPITRAPQSFVYVESV